MLDEIINKVLVCHNDFKYDEVKEICEDFLAEIPVKIKQETKIKRLNKYINTEFELESWEILFKSDKEYNLDTIPKYLFEWKSKIASSLINIKNLTKHIEKTHLFEKAELKINKDDKIALIWKNGCWKTTLLKMIIWKEENIDWTIDIASNLKIWYLSQDLFWKSEKNTLREEMLEVYPEINSQINRLAEIRTKTLQVIDYEYFFHMFYCAFEEVNSF